MELNFSSASRYYRDTIAADKDLKKAESFSEEDRRLCQWLSSNSEIWDILPLIFFNRLSTRFAFDRWLEEAAHQAFDLSQEQRAAGAFFIVLELREYAGHSLHNLFGDPPHYEDLLRRVHKRVAKQFKRPWDDEGGVKGQERMLADILIGETLRYLTPEELKAILDESKLASVSDFQHIKSRFSEAILNNGMLGIEKIVGKNLAGKVALRIFERGMSKQMGKREIRHLSARFLGKVSPLIAKRLSLYLGIGLLAKDAYDLGGEATRITNPAVISIALIRSLSQTNAA